MQKQESRQRKQKQNKAHKNKQQTKQQKTRQHGWWSADQFIVLAMQEKKMIALYHQGIGMADVKQKRRDLCELVGT